MYGPDLNKGLITSQILSFYYTDTHIQTRPYTISVQGYGTMDINDYAAGQGEVPSHACGSAAQIAARPDKYSATSCWPEEAIKAQVIAFRSYGISVFASKGKSICTDESCQAYDKNGNGRWGTKWAADETKDQVVVSNGYTQNGQVIEAYYSGDNSNGWGTADNDTIWSPNSGNGTPYSYLRAKNDSDFAVHINATKNINFTWRTNSYPLSSFDQLLAFGSSSSRFAATASSVKNTVGTIASIRLEPDPSGRVKRVRFTGTNGASATMAGWYFQTMWNSWVSTAHPSGQTDVIYSNTYFFLQAD